MKKLTILVLISSFLTFTAAMALAHDNDNGFKHFNGTYEMISSGICLHSVDGWVEVNNPPPPNGNGFVGFVPVDPKKVWAGTATARATWIFNRDGTGTADGKNYASIFPGGLKDSYEAESLFKFDFTYEITNNGVITVIGTSGGAKGLVMNGMLSNDRKIMTLLSAAQIQNFSEAGLGYLINNNMRILIKVSN